MISLLSDGPDGFYRTKRTLTTINSPKWKLGGRGMFFAGSCFADNLFKEYEQSNLRVSAAPFGNIYNPESLATAAELIAAGGGIKSKDCFRKDDRYYHFMFHTLLSGKDPDRFASDLNHRLNKTKEFIEKSEAAILTLGTAFVYRLEGNGLIVNNCHKLPAKRFNRNCLETGEATMAVERTIDALFRINPSIKIILSLSPVRHLRDDASENSLSKAVLRCAIDKTVKKRPERLWYFPSYEILLDELRDYRWYADDLSHPSAETVSYIISRFINAVYDKDFHDFLKRWLTVIRDLNHRPLSPDSDDYRLFRSRTEKKQKDLIREFPDFISSSMS